MKTASQHRHRRACLSNGLEPPFVKTGGMSGRHLFQIVGANHPHLTLVAISSTSCADPEQPQARMSECSTHVVQITGTTSSHDELP